MALFARSKSDDEGSSTGEIVWRTERRRIGDLVEWEKNPRRLTTKQAADLRESLRKFGYVEEIVVNADGRSIIGGHMRRKVALASALLNPDAMVDVRIPSRALTEDEGIELAIRLNRNVGEWDYDVLANYFHVPELVEWGFDPNELGFGDGSESDGGSDREDEEIVAANNIVPRMKLGSRATIDKRHVLICGDSRDIEVVRAASSEIDLVITSPPYNVGKDYRSSSDDLPTDEYLRFINDIANAVVGVLKDGRFVVWNVGVSKNTLPHRHYCALEDHGLSFFRSYAWTKAGTVYPVFNHTINKARVRYVTSDYHHEWVGLFTKGAAEEGPPFDGEVPDFLHRDVIDQIVPNTASTEIPTVAKPRPEDSFQNHPKKLHSAAFPVALARGFIDHLSARDEVVFDPFCGSGSTIMAAVESGRIGCGVELDPTSCEITLLRAEKRGLQIIIEN